MKRQQIGLSVAVIAAIATASWVALRPKAAGTAAGSGPASGASAPAQTVGIATAQQRDVPVIVEAAGSVVPVDTFDLRPQVASTVRGIHIKDGQFVHQGDLLFTLDDRADKAALDKAREQLLRDQATLADAKRQLQRSTDLAAQNFIAASAVDTARTAVEAAQATVRADDAAVQSAVAALSYDSLRAPFSGRAGALAVNLGSLVSPSGNALVTISRIDPIAVSFTVPEAQLPALLQGLKAGAPVSISPNGSVPGTPRSAASAVPPVVGKLVFVDNAIDATTGTIRAKAEVPNAQQALWPGQYVSARLQLRTLEGAITIPQAAVVQRDTERGVYVVGADSTVSWRRLQSRYASGDLLVVDGLQAGERVVVEGKQNLRPGGLVREAVKTAKAGASGASAAASSASRTEAGK